MAIKDNVRNFFDNTVDQIIKSNFIGVQKYSYEEFLQINVDENKREDKGLQKLFKEIFDFGEEKLKVGMEFLSYTILPSKFNEQECIDKNRTYAADLKVKFKCTLYSSKINKIVKKVEEKEIYFGQIPLMCEDGSFIVNGKFEYKYMHLMLRKYIFEGIDNFLLKIKLQSTY